MDCRLQLIKVYEIMIDNIIDEMNAKLGFWIVTSETINEIIIDAIIVIKSKIRFLIMLIISTSA